MSDNDRINMEKYCHEYMNFLNVCKTERECVEYIESELARNGFTRLQHGQHVSAGDKVYRVMHGKAIYAAVIGQSPISEGARIAAAHIDSPRIDLKTNPIYEDTYAYFKTHYYGGLRKHQWVSIPLALHGVVILSDGNKVSVKIGESESDLVLTITDLLPHLAGEQKKKALGEAYSGEQLNILIGSEASNINGCYSVKSNILKVLSEQYGIDEEDFASAELSAVPAFNSREVGLDKSMIGAYGQDDRVCAFAALKALFNAHDIQQTAVCIFADKEEVGNAGMTSMDTRAFDTFMLDLCASESIPVDYCYENSYCMSMDVTAAYDPNYPEPFDTTNDSFVNRGLSIMKYSGSHGKALSNDASAETVGKLRRILDTNNVLWHISEMGKVDVGGGGTVALCMAARNIETVDAGTPVMAMHSPFEVTGKLDCYMTFRGAQAFFTSNN